MNTFRALLIVIGLGCIACAAALVGTHYLIHQGVPVQSEQAALAMLGPGAYRKSATVVKLGNGHFMYMADLQTASK